MTTLRFCKIFFCAMLALFTLITTVYAHSGGTDAYGGHYERESGEYHYHHGEKAHQHYDKDGDGIKEYCGLKLINTYTVVALVLVVVLLFVLIYFILRS